MNKRSIAGVSHSTASLSDSELTDAAAPLIRTSRRSGAVGMVPVPRSTPPPIRAAIAKLPAPSLRAISEIGTWRSPRPGVSNDTASRILVLPAPLGPLSSTNPGPGSISAAA